MKRKNEAPNRRQITILRQVCQLIPPHLVSKLARETGVAQKERSFSAWSHVVAMIYAQISHAWSLNDVCDGLRLHLTALWAIRGARPPARNTLSHANKVRDSALAERLFWAMLRQLQSSFPGFSRGAKGKAAWRFRRTIHVVDSTTIQLVASCVNWARHRRRKAAAKCHLRLEVGTFLPKFALVETAGEHDSLRAKELCAGLSRGEIVIFDRAYLDYAHLWSLAVREVIFVTRTKDNLDCKIIQTLPRSADKRIVKDELILLQGFYSRLRFGAHLRRVTAVILVDGQPKEMAFLTNQMEWSPSSVCDLYRCRWSIEVFFKELKQTMQLVDFLGHSANAVKWQVWTALLVHLLVRFQAWRSQWAHSFTRLVTYLRSALWLERDLDTLLARCGTASGQFRWLGRPEQAWLPGFAGPPMGQQT